eukprot:Gb_21526 [translate_table: standard]
MGLRKIEIKKLPNNTLRQATFWKRKGGVVKKASEISILCGVEVGFIVFSTGGSKVFTFGHPSLRHLIHRLHNRPPPPFDNQKLQADLEILEGNYNAFEVRVKGERAMNTTLKRANKRVQSLCSENKVDFWWAEDTKDFGIAQSKRFYYALKLLKTNIQRRMGTSSDVMQ